MEYIVKKSRRRTVSMCFDRDDRLIISCPLYCNDSQIQSFLKEKQNWISKTYAEISKRKTELASHFSQGSILLFGRKTIVVSQSKHFFYDNVSDILYIKGKNIITSLKPFILDFISNRVRIYAKQLNVRFVNLKLSNAKTKWGSCRADKTLFFNWRNIFLPIDLQDYIIIHELCHLKQMNHSKQFWSEVEKFCRNYRILRKQLKNEFAYIINVFR